MSDLFDSITEYFEADGWHIHRIDEDTAYSVTFEGKNGKWVCIAQVIEDDQEFVFYSAYPDNAPESKRAEIAELLTRFNYNLTFGNFEMDFDDGHIRFRTCIDITGHELGAMLIAQVVYRNVLTMDHCLPAIQMVLHQGKLPTTAIAAIERAES